MTLPLVYCVDSSALIRYQANKQAHVLPCATQGSNLSHHTKRKSREMSLFFFWLGGIRAPEQSGAFNLSGKLPGVMDFRLGNMVGFAFEDLQNQ